MTSCPRCGTENQAGKAACWKCLAPIPSSPPAAQTPPIILPERKPAAPVRRKLSIPDITVAFPKRLARPDKLIEPEEPVAPMIADEEEAIPPPAETADLEAEPVPAPAAIVDENPMPVIPAQDEVPMEPAADSIDLQQRDKPFSRADEEDEEAPPRHKGEYIYIAGAAFTRKSTTWIFLLVVLALLLSGIFFLYYYNFRAQPQPMTPEQAAQEYLLALRMKQETTRQQLATPDSRGLLLPSWFNVTEARLVEVADTQDSKATARARITLAPVRSIELPKKLEDAASRDYDIEFTLEPGKYWLVDQRALFRSLHRQLKEQNPGVTFPAWDGVSE